MPPNRAPPATEAGVAHCSSSFLSLACKPALVPPPMISPPAVADNAMHFSRSVIEAQLVTNDRTATHIKY